MFKAIQKPAPNINLKDLSPKDLSSEQLQNELDKVNTQIAQYTFAPVGDIAPPFVPPHMQANILLIYETEKAALEAEIARRAEPCSVSPN